MNKFFHKIAAYTALILLSALPLSTDLFKEATEKADSVISSSTDKNSSETKRK